MRGLRDEHVTPMADRSDSGRTMNVDADIALGSHEWFARVNPHSHSKRPARKLLLPLAGRSKCIACT